MGYPHPFEMGIIAGYAHLRPFQRLTRSLRYRFAQPTDLHFAALVSDPLFVFPEQFGKELLRQAKRHLLSRSLYKSDVDLTAKYFAYPLQLHPESTTSVDGPAFSDEWSNVVGIASNLPFGHKLYVNDHKHAAGRLPFEF